MVFVDPVAMASKQKRCDVRKVIIIISLHHRLIHALLAINEERQGGNLRQTRGTCVVLTFDLSLPVVARNAEFGRQH